MSHFMMGRTDAGGKTGPEAASKTDWIRHALRLFSLIDNQVRSLRKHQVINAYKLPRDGGPAAGSAWCRAAFPA